jgi:hypothetical protein
MLDYQGRLARQQYMHSAFNFDIKLFKEINKVDLNLFSNACVVLQCGPPSTPSLWLALCQC